MLSFNLLVMTILLIVYLVTILLFRKNGIEYLFFYSIFFMYLSYLMKYTLFPLPITGPTLEMLRSTRDNIGIFSEINFMPFNHTFSKDMFQNIIMTVPFGFGYYFVLNRKSNFVVISLLIGIIIETIQLLISLSINFAYRAVDINDVIFNFLGSIIGFFLFFLFSISINYFYKNREADGYIRYILMKTNVSSNSID